jgi:hypothetical protein
MEGTTLIAGWNHPLAADFAAHAARQGRRQVLLSSSLPTGVPDVTASRLVVFLGPKKAGQEEWLRALAAFARECGIRSVCLVSSFRVHLGDRATEEFEAVACRQFEGVCERVVVVRPGHLRRGHGTWVAAIPERFCSCFVETDELFHVIDQLLAAGRPSKGRVYTLLGPNRPWCSLAPRSSAAGVIRALLSWLLIEHALAGVFALLARWLPRLRTWNFDTLHPRSTRELLSLYNPYNCSHVKIVGYNNGVTHFGHRYPDKTVVSTTRCVRPPRIHGDLVKLDAGTTIHAGAEALRAVGKEFHVVPNFTYVSVGTAFFVPIHGSASRFSTVGETIEKVVLYDPVADRFIAARRSDPDFVQYLYDLRADVLLLRLTLRVKEKSSYYLRRQELIQPSSQQVLDLFRDREASNVELRKAAAGSGTVQVCKYYADTAEGLEVPRDRLGSLWDRLEENPLTRVLFHGLTRRLAHHVELFLSEAEFAVFWDTHAALPIKKIQLRFIRQDGMPNSPFRKQDCISADLFMLKKHRRAFEDYLHQNFGAVRMNPGKHSMG